MPLAPILVSVYNRCHHFKNCIESLKDNNYADKSHLFIAVDAPYRDEDVRINKKIIEYAKSIKGYKEITLFIRRENLGALPNINLAWKDIFNNYEKLILFEDDNVFSPNFLEYMNDGLEFHKDEERIFSISGYNYMITIPKNYKKDIYMARFFCMGIRDMER